MGIDDNKIKVLWDFLGVGDALEKAEVVFVLGSFDLRIPNWGSDIILKGYSQYIVMSGGKGRLTPEDWENEASKFAQVAYLKGISKDKVFVEDESKNTRENLLYSWKLIDKEEITPQKVIIVSQPFMQKRIKGLVEKLQEYKRLGNFQLILPSSPFTPKTYLNEVVDKEELTNLLVGEIQRLIDYPKKDFIAKQNIPENVLKTAVELIKLGFTKYLISKSIFP